MTREEQVKICMGCVHNKLDIQKGIVCKKTGEPATFETTCSDFDSNNPVQLTPEEKYGPTEIKGFFAFYVFWSIPLGIVLTLVRSFASFDVSAYAASNFLLAYDVIFTTVYVATCIYVIRAFVKRYTDAVFMAKYQLLMLFFSNLIVALFGVTETTTFTGMIWAVIFFVYLCLSEDVKDLIPRETRKLTKFSKIFVPSSLIIPIICLLIGMVETFNGHSLFADSKEKIEDLCKVAATTLPDGDMHSIYVDGNSVVYGFDTEWGELSKPTIDRLGATLRESMLSNFNIDNDSRDFFQLCVDADFDVVYKYTDRSFGTCVTVVLTPEHLSQAMQSDYVHTITADSWNEILDFYNSELPKLYFEDCFVENVSINQLQNRIRYDLKLINLSVETLNRLSHNDFEAHMLSIFDSVSDDIMTLIEYSGYDIEYNFTADCLSWWSKSVILEHEQIFSDSIH